MSLPLEEPVFTVCDAVLREWCTKPQEELSSAEAHELAYGILGTNLSRWLLRPEVLRRVAEHDQMRGYGKAEGYWLARPELPGGQGLCWVVFTQQDFPLLRPAFVLPFQWRQGQPHSKYLPPAMVEQAEDVLRAAGLQGFGLDGSSEAGIKGCDLSRLEQVECRSAWVPLFGGLVVGAEGGLPDRGVWASGEWSPTDGVQRIGELKAKLEVAWEWGAKQFFLPTSQREEAEQWVAWRGANLAIGVLAERKPDGKQYDARSALREYLADFGAPPDPAAPREARKQYYLRQTSDERRRAYYRRCLLDDVAADCRRRLDSEGCLPHPTHMVTILSTSPELVELGVQVFKPSRVLVLYTAETKEYLSAVRSTIKDRMPECEVVPRQFEVGENMVSQMRTAIEDFISGVEPGQIVYDLLPGTKEMTLALAIELSQPGVWLYYLRHKRQGLVPVPFEQTPILRKAGPSMGKRPAEHVG